ncbi:Disease resistance protein RFL1 [Euphorbia peplus]|nr:Disease resistance protein RFL1 [Euphorbia peplus]
METDQVSEYAVKTPTGFMCKFCSKGYHHGTALRIIPHLAKIECHDLDNCLLVPTDVQNRLRQGLQLSKKRDSISTHQCIPTGKRAPLSTIGVSLPATSVAGKQFDDYIKDIWSCLMDTNDVFIIGIHGIGGVGKTQVAKLVNNKLLQCPNNFGHVFWVSTSPNWSTWNRDTSSSLCRVRDLQSSVSKAVGVDLLDEDDESKRAAQLTKGLSEKRNSILILDDVWDYIPLQEVGIPVGLEGCTVLFTTRSLEVCRQLGCQRKIEIKCLPPDESYELFKKYLGKETTLSREVEEISRLVADKCVGLPLAITIMARYMKGVTDIHQWRNALTGHTREKADMEIFQKLKTSYDYLKDPTLQHCFIYCASLIDCNRGKMEMAEYLVDEGIIKNMNSRMAELDKALTMLDFLRDAGLLEITIDYYTDAVEMNELIRSMALQIMEESLPRAMIKNGMSLKELPDEESWTEDLVRVNLERNEIENIPCNFSPSCSNLSTLLLSKNYKLRCIGDSFFEEMPQLKYLDLSDTSIESLPRSVCGLVNLTTLLLSMCRYLKNVPSVAELKALEKLDLSSSGVEQVPEGIEMLSKLTYLDLFSTDVKELNPEILEKLSNLQFLRLREVHTVKGEVAARLARLETLICSFDNIVELNKYLVHLKGGFKRREPPLRLHFLVGGALCFNTRTLDILYDGEDVFAEKDDGWSVVGLNNCNLNEADLLNDFQDIVIENCNQARSLCNFSPIKGATELKYFSIQECDGLEFLCSLSVTGQDVLENIEYMELFFLEKLCVLVKKEGDLAYGSSCFSNLTRFFIQGCSSIKRLFPTNLVPNLKNLKRLYVLGCPRMEEIFGAEEEEEDGESKIVEKKICCLPELSILWLEDLPRLKRFCGEGTICGLSKRCSIKAERCPTIATDGVVVYDF